jgi:hypothetical protein
VRETPRSLRDVQRWLAGVILHPDGVDESRAGPIVRPPRGTVGERLRAYTDGYPARLHEALQEAFPALAHLVGAAAFAEAVRRYRVAVPDGIYNLADVGRCLPQFLTDDAVGRAYPFAPDLARLEWAVQRAFHARPEAPFDAASVAGWGPDEWSSARIRFQPGATVVVSAWPIHALWRARETPIDDIDIEVEGRPETVLVHRVGYRVACDPIGADEASVLGRLLGGHTLEESTADLAVDQAEALGGWTAGWVQRGIVACCER